MTPEHWQEIRNLLHCAMQLKVEERPAFLNQHCYNDPELRQELDMLLAAGGELDSSFLEAPAIEQVAANQASSSSLSMLAAGTRLGPYLVHSLLGAGGMGEVYRARDTRLDRTVAIKVIPRALAPDAVLRQRFQREARAISSLQHPNICTLYDVGSEEGTDYLVMEYLEGETLATRLTKGPLPLDLTVWTPKAFLLGRVELSGQAQVLKTGGVSQWLFGIVPSPDGRSLAYGAQTWDNNVWLLENF